MLPDVVIYQKYSEEISEEDIKLFHRKEVSYKRRQMLKKGIFSIPRYTKAGIADVEYRNNLITIVTRLKRIKVSRIIKKCILGYI